MDTVMRNDVLNDLFRARFQGHESPVDPGIWNNIQAGLAAAPHGVALEDLMRERLQDHGADVPAGAWNNIQDQLGAPAAGGTGGSQWGTLGWVASGLAVVAVGVSLYLALDPAEKEDLLPPIVVEERIAAPVTPEVDQPASSTLVGEVPAPEMTITEERTVRLDPAGEVQAGEPAATRSTARQGRDDHATHFAGSIPPKPAVSSLPLTNPTSGADDAAFVQGVLDELTREADLEVQHQASQIAADPSGPPPVPEDPWHEEVDTVVPLPRLFMPSSFTPNGDGINDTYVVVADDFAQVRLRVFNVTNNQLVFSSDHGEPWDGTNCATGHYVVAVEAITNDGRLVTEGKVVYLNTDP